MLVPLSWLKEYVDIVISPKTLAERLSEVGIGVEKIDKTEDDIIFELEITPNRADLLSLVGIAREIAVIENKKIKLETEQISKAVRRLPFTIHNDFKLLEHYVAVVISDVKIKNSPEWMRERLVKLGLRPINNVVDITNYVMFELGIPLHAFDYDEIHKSEFFVEKSKGGEKFVSVDEITYTLPKDAIIIKDADRIVDLVGIKGGLNSGIKSSTQNVLLQTSVDDPVLIRRASQSLSLRSDASNILEKGIDKNGLLPALNRAASLIVKLADGQIASSVFHLKKRPFLPWALELSLPRLEKILGVSIPKRKVLSILQNLNLSPKLTGSIIHVTIPTYRNDLRIEEDLIEEVARHFGYNKLPKTLPAANIRLQKIPYFKDQGLEEKIKNIIIGCGFSEIYTYSLVSEKDLLDNEIDPKDTLRIDNPVSREFEYLRPTLRINLKKALLQNKANFESINLFELGKVYHGKSLDEQHENYTLCLASNRKSFRQVVGAVEELFKRLCSSYSPSKILAVDSSNSGIIVEFDIQQLLTESIPFRAFVPVPKYPAIFEDLALLIPKKIAIGDVLDEIKKQSSLIKNVTILDQYDSTTTFHITYQHLQSNLTNQEVAVARKRIIKNLKEKLNVKIME